MNQYDPFKLNCGQYELYVVLVDVVIGCKIKYRFKIFVCRIPRCYICFYMSHLWFTSWVDNLKVSSFSGINDCESRVGVVFINIILLVISFSCVIIFISRQLINTPIKILNILLSSKVLIKLLTTVAADLLSEMVLWYLDIHL